MLLVVVVGCWLLLLLISYPGDTPDKLMSLWKGPFIITDIKNQTHYCRDLVNNTVIPYFIDILKLYVGSNDIDPKDLSMADKDYRGDPTKKKTLFSRVRRLGYSPEEDTWELYSAISDCLALDEFVKSHHELAKLK